MNLNTIKQSNLAQRALFVLMAIFFLLSFSGLNSVSAHNSVQLNQQILNIQKEWDYGKYKLSRKDRLDFYKKLTLKTQKLIELQGHHAEAYTWHGINLSTLAEQKGGLGALSLIIEAKRAFEKSIQLDPSALKGSALVCLGTLYYMVPSWPIGFKDYKKAEYLLRTAKKIDPNGMDVNYYLGTLYKKLGQHQKALKLIQQSIQATPRQGRERADLKRREEIKQILLRYQG